jgi:hypothetical protein
VLIYSLIVLTAAAVGGLSLFALYEWVKPRGSVWWPGAAHGALGLLGFALLLAALRGPPRGVSMGADQFGLIAAVLVGLGLLLGAVVFIGRLRRRPPVSLVIGIHAAFAVGGIVMLAAYAASPS